jgi:putative FmdB family regulatory protein
MPLYDYACRRCNHEFESLVGSADEPVDCPECNSRRTERLMSVPAKPRSDSSSLATTCNPQLPPCGPGCCRM